MKTFPSKCLRALISLNFFFMINEALTLLHRGEFVDHGARLFSIAKIINDGFLKLESFIEHFKYCYQRFLVTRKIIFYCKN